MLEYATNNIRKTYRQHQADNKSERPLPAQLIPHKGDYKEVERQPHQRSGYGLHNKIHHLATIKVEQKE
jgi:hypothetical protein